MQKLITELTLMEMFINEQLKTKLSEEDQVHLNTIKIIAQHIVDEINERQKEE